MSASSEHIISRTSTASPSEVPAKTSLRPAIDRALTVLVVACSGSASEWWENCARDGSYSKTSLRELVFGSIASETLWNGKATRRYRSHLRRAIAALRIDVGGCSSSPSLPTLTETGNLLAPSMQKWPAHRMLPTLTAQTYGTNRGGSAGRVGETRGSFQTLAKMLPMLTARDSKGIGTRRNNLPREAGGHLSPTFCEWFMGAPIGWTEPVKEWRRSATRVRRSKPKRSDGL